MLARRASSATPPASPLSASTPSPAPLRQGSPSFTRAHSRDEDDDVSYDEDEDDDEDEDEQDEVEDASPGRRRRRRSPLLHNSPKTAASPLTAYLRRSASEGSARTLVLPSLNAAPRCTNCHDEASDSVPLAACHCGLARYCSEHCRSQDFMKAHIKDCPGVMSLSLRGMKPSFILEAILASAGRLDLPRTSLKEFYLGEIRQRLDLNKLDCFVDLAYAQSPESVSREDEDVTFLSIPHETPMSQLVSLLSTELASTHFVWMDVFCAPFHLFLRAMEPRNNELPRPVWYPAGIRSVIGKLKRFEACLYPATAPLTKSDPWTLLETHDAVSQRKPVFSRFTSDALNELEELTRTGKWIRTSINPEDDVLERFLAVEGYPASAQRPNLRAEFEHVGAHLVDEAAVVLLKGALFKYAKNLESQLASATRSSWTALACLGEIYAALGDLPAAEQRLARACAESETAFAANAKGASSPPSNIPASNSEARNSDGTAAASLHLQRVGLWTSLGYCQKALGHAAAALGSFQRAIDLAASARSGSEDGILEQILRVTKLRDVYGRCLRDARRLDEARAVFEQSLAEKERAQATRVVPDPRLRQSIASSHTELAGCDVMDGHDALGALHLSRALESMLSADAATPPAALIDCVDDLANCLQELAEEEEEEEEEAAEAGVWRPIVEGVLSKLLNAQIDESMSTRDIVRALLTNSLERKRALYGPSDERVAHALDALLQVCYVPALSTYSYAEDLGFTTSSGIDDGVIPMVTTRGEGEESEATLELLHAQLLQACHAHRASRGPYTMGLARALYQTACVAFLLGHHHEALPGFMSAAEIRLRVYPKKVARIAHVYLDAARSAVLSRQFERASVLYQTALSAARARDEGEGGHEDNLDAARALFGLAAFAKDEESERQTYQDSLAAFRHALQQPGAGAARGVQAELARCLLGLGTCQSTLAADARGLLTECLELLPSNLSSSSEIEALEEDVALTRVDAAMALGDCLRESFDEIELALLRYREADATLRRLRAAREHDVLAGRAAECMDRVGSALEDQQKFELALDAYRECLDLYTRLENKRGVAHAMDNVAACQKALGLHEEAARMGKEAWELAERFLGPTDPTTAELKAAWGA